MSDPTGSQGTTWQVVLPGRFGPAYHQAFASMGVDQVATCTVFRLHRSADSGIPDVAAMLARRGLVVLSIRRVPGAAPDGPPHPRRVMTGRVADGSVGPHDRSAPAPGPRPVEGETP